MDELSQSAVVGGAILLAFLVYITMRGELGAYLDVIGLRQFSSKSLQGFKIGGQV